jgi:hypothetical protein
MRISAAEIMTVGVEGQIALSRNVSLPARQEITALRLVDLAAESLIVERQKISRHRRQVS